MKWWCIINLGYEDRAWWDKRSKRKTPLADRIEGKIGVKLEPLETPVTPSVLAF